MLLLEYETKKIFRDESIPTPRSYVVSSEAEARNAAEDFGIPVFVKAQVFASGRMRKGGVIEARSLDQVEAAALKLFSAEFDGHSPRKLMVEERVDIQQELFLSIAIDDARGLPVILTSLNGGIEIEELTSKYPDRISSTYIDILRGLRKYEAREIAMKMGFGGALLPTIEDIIWKLYRVFERYDATIVESNPLAVTKSGEIQAVGAAMSVDDDASYRHPALKTSSRNRGEDSTVTDAAQMGITYVQFEGDIGIVCSGAGLAMSTVDLVTMYGGDPANFLDTGGRITRGHVKTCLDIISRNPKVNRILVNMYGGINPIVEGADGIVDFLRSNNTRIPVVVKARGNMENDAWRVLECFGIETVRDIKTEVAAERIVNCTRSR